jgi:hypothetical protein
MSTGHVVLPMLSTAAPKFDLPSWIATQSPSALAAQEEQRAVVASRLPEWVGEDAAVVAAMLNLDGVTS